jgi:hypothetical protein
MTVVTVVRPFVCRVGAATAVPLRPVLLFQSTERLPQPGVQSHPAWHQARGLASGERIAWQPHPLGGEPPKRAARSLGWWRDAALYLPPVFACDSYPRAHLTLPESSRPVTISPHPYPSPSSPSPHSLRPPRPPRLQYDPVVRQHVLFNEGKMPKGRGGRRAGK